MDQGYTMLGFVVIVILYAVIGLMAAAGAILIARKMLPPKAEQIFYAMFLILIAAFYLAFVAYFGMATAWRLEAAVVVGFVAIGLLGARLHVLALLVAGQRNRNLDEVADDLLDIAADVTHLGELGRLHLDERRARQARQAPGDFRLADAGRPDHQDVLRHHLFAQLFVELQPAPAVAQRDGDGALGVGLSDNEAVELGDDFAG